ncbi:MAG TPA: peptidyl-alpha-hydroxyglycine alpha-amidating lyase family protein [Candidatus Acidoferrum sp.]|nr:peptidyl-alpha-hydroxyglycine alpha-amidating lyase family protein [Candidatus Acidoferrum sp.]
MSHSMRVRNAMGILILLTSVLLGTAFAQEKGGENETGPYAVVDGWPQPLGHPGWTWGSQGGVFAESPNRIYILQRGELPIPEKAPEGYTGGYGAFGTPATRGTPRLENCILIVDGDGKLIESWTQWDHLFAGGRGPHHVKISPYDREKHVWVIDDMLHQVFEFTRDGKQLVMTLGEKGVQGEDDKHFGRPTDIAWLPDGTFFISDGYINTRVVKFDKSGKYLVAWGKKGSGPGEFNLPHSIDIDANRRVYVADRSNSRIQIFDENGKYLSEWDHIRSPYHIMVTADQHLWVADGVTNKFLKYDLDGKLLYSWGTYGSFPGAFWGVHQFSVDSDGNLYGAEAFGGRTQKFRPKKGADPATLIGQPVKIVSSRD